MYIKSYHKIHILTKSTLFGLIVKVLDHLNCTPVLRWKTLNFKLSVVKCV